MDLVIVRNLRIARIDCAMSVATKHVTLPQKVLNGRGNFPVRKQLPKSRDGIVGDSEL